MSKILLIEDEAGIRVAFEAVLRSDDHSVISLPNGLGLLDAMPGVDLVITDIMMPHVGGFEVIKLLQMEYDHVPVIVISGGDRFDPAVQNNKIESSWVKAYLKKPITRKELLNAVKDVLPPKT